MLTAVESRLLGANGIWEIVIAVILAVAGGLTRLLSLKDVKLKRWQIFSELFASAFCGFMILLLARAFFGLSGDWLGLVSGMAGWMGPRILDAVADLVIHKKLGIENKEKGGDE